jgi:uncharacterized repeat protein (TIGR03943 family)
VKKDAQAVVLLLLGGTLIKTSLTSTYLNYVKPGQRWLLVLGGGVLVMVASVALWQTITARSRGLSPDHADAYFGPDARPDPHERAAPDEHGVHIGPDPVAGTGIPPTEGPAGQPDGDAAAAPDGIQDVEPADEVEEPHRLAEPRVAWLLLVPALALLLFAPPPIGAFQAGRSGTVLSGQDRSDHLPLPSGDPVVLGMFDYASRAVFDPGSIGARRIQLTGFVVPGPHGEVYLTRMVLTCCAADARPIKVGLTGDVPPGLAPGTWLTVVGTYVDRSDRDPVNRQRIPYLQLTSAQVTVPPAEPYET